MSRDQRVRDNWALLHTIEQAGKTGAPVGVVFNLVRLRPKFTARGCLPTLAEAGQQAEVRC